jgi:hypothetical protein
LRLTITATSLGRTPLAIGLSNSVFLPSGPDATDGRQPEVILPALKLWINLPGIPQAASYFVHGK